ncbi:A24 family peptidase [Mycoavidus sp. B2-EB]|uniref:prepilin peptidase n=1 Tax=Mycoavidus sp. B2-EB TaxID=2651972 RepID=UPI001625155C|nr:A24 family peptidase [Mycoavidus sp. B2-EB]BBO59104.1 type 4 prepilin-like proteins leader peptide-processing enzyme [Mycoavidus sp. B2-EB]
MPPSAATLNAWAANFAVLPIGFQYICAILLGLIIGSFLSVVVHRLPSMLQMAWQEEWNHFAADSNTADATHTQAITRKNPLGKPTYNLCLPRSHCPSCQHTLTPFENLPLVGYLLCRGRCSACHISISLRYPALELLSAGLAAGALWHFGASWQALAVFGFSATLFALALIDIDTHLLPDTLTLPLIWAGLLVNLNASFTPLHSAVIGAVAGYLLLWLVYWGFRLLRGKEGMGYGDFKLLAALGAWLGWLALPQIVLLASATGALFGLIALMSGHLKREQPLPFGPFLVAAGMITLFWRAPFFVG